MSLNVDLLENSFRLFSPHKKSMVKAFYDRLYTTYPEIRGLFKNDDSSSLINSFEFVVEHLRQEDVLVPYLKKLRDQHVRDNVRQEDYPKVGQALLDTFEEFGGEIWSMQLKKEWQVCFEWIGQVICEKQKSLSAVS